MELDGRTGGGGGGGRILTDVMIDVTIIRAARPLSLPRLASTHRNNL